jgi:hypothetical protein
MAHFFRSQTFKVDGSAREGQFILFAAGKKMLDQCLDCGGIRIVLESFCATVMDKDHRAGRARPG